MVSTRKEVRIRKTVVSAFPRMLCRKCFTKIGMCRTIYAVFQSWHSIPMRWMHLRAPCVRMLRTSIANLVPAYSPPPQRRGLGHPGLHCTSRMLDSTHPIHIITLTFVAARGCMASLCSCDAGPIRAGVRARVTATINDCYNQDPSFTDRKPDSNPNP